MNGFDSPNKLHILEKPPFGSGRQNSLKTKFGNLQTELSGTQFDKITTRYEYWEVLSPPSVYCYRECPYIFVPITSFGGLFWGSKQGEKDKEVEKEGTQNATKTATILWRFLFAIFEYETGDLFKILAIFCPPIEVTAIFVYCFSCRYLVEQGLRQLGWAGFYWDIRGPDAWISPTPTQRCPAALGCPKKIG